ncbi:hypothetical protein HB770_11755 [Rhizobium leguminosarum bv. viciae]|uniref:Transmembrane protein n=1 Tax=Rhizobium leguminosarum bv. viciae TaxID=387 RepID=A0A7G6RJG6_RHILV|nr:hypothetical protein HB770_11755 [Rhizobium leguminosarum bv. viciae]
MGKLTFKEAVKLDLDSIKSVNGKVTQDAKEASFAQHILKEDLGELKNDWLAVYSLDEDTRDRLIAHARQDAALACASSANTKKEVKRLRRLVWFFGLINLAMLLVLVFRR